MSWSLGEMRALSVKAARGAGMVWGLAEEAGFAVYWLEERGGPGVAALAGYLEALDKYSIVSCPIALGASVSDVGAWNGAFPVRLHQPVLALPFLANVLEAGNVALAWAGNSVGINGSGMCDKISSNTLAAGIHKCQISECANRPALQERLSRVPDDRMPHVKMLEKFAHNTYAPSTEESRAKGAGAGLTDND